MTIPPPPKVRLTDFVRAILDVIRGMLEKPIIRISEQAKPRIIPSLLQILESDPADGESGWTRSLVSDDAIIAFVATLPNESKPAEATQAHLESSVPLPMRNALLTWLKGYRSTGKTTTSDYQDNPMAELHCPTVEGCEAEYTTKKAHESGGGLEVKVMGPAFGGGMSHTFKVSQEDAWKVEAGCMRVLGRIRVHGREWKHRTTGKVTWTYAAEIDPNYRATSTLPASDHHCRPGDYAAVSEALAAWKDMAFDNRRLERALCAAPRHSDKHETEKAGEHKFSFQLPIVVPGVGTFKVALESKFTSSVRYSYKLISGHRYVAYYQATRYWDRPSAITLWAWDNCEVSTR
jgi:hypothetical protein